MCEKELKINPCYNEIWALKTPLHRLQLNQKEEKFVKSSLLSPVVLGSREQFQFGARSHNKTKTRNIQKCAKSSAIVETHVMNVCRVLVLQRVFQFEERFHDIFTMLQTC